MRWCDLWFVGDRPDCSVCGIIENDSQIPQDPKDESSSSEKPKEPELKIDLSAIKIGATVRHKIFGEGVIAKFNGKHIYVEFKTGQKNFVFPDAFKQGFLKI